MRLYCKKPFQQFKKGDELPKVNDTVARRLLASGKATKTKPKAKKEDK